MLLTVFVCTRYWPEPLKPKPLRAANKRFDCFAFRLCKHWKRNSEYLAVFCRWFWIHNIHIHIHVLAHHFHLVWRTRCCWLSQAISFLIFMQNYRLNTCYTFTVELALALLFLCSHKKAISNQNLQFCHSFVVFALVSLETPFILLFKRIVGCFPLFSKANQIMKRTLFRLSLENKRVHSLTAWILLLLYLLVRTLYDLGSRSIQLEARGKCSSFQCGRTVPWMYTHKKTT